MIKIFFKEWLTKFRTVIIIFRDVKRKGYPGSCHKIGNVLFLKLDGRFRGVHFIICVKTYIMLHLFFYMHQMKKIFKRIPVAYKILSKSLKILYQYNLFLFSITLFSKCTKRIFNIKTLKIGKILVTINLDIRFSSSLY